MASERNTLIGSAATSYLSAKVDVEPLNSLDSGSDSISHFAANDATGPAQGGCPIRAFPSVPGSRDPLSVCYARSIMPGTESAYG